MMDMKRIYNILLIMILSLFLLPLGGCFDSDINRSMYEADGEEMQRENHIVGATLKGMQGLVIPTREHLYQFMDAMAGGAYGGYLEGIVDTWVMKFSTFNPEQGWLKSPFADPIKDMYPQYRDMMNKTDDPVALAFGKILRVCIMHRVTDIYGPIPYSKMMDNDNSGEDLAVPYDSQEQVYTQMLKELEEAEIQKQKKQMNHAESPSILKLENRRLEIDTLLKSLYEDHAFGRISAFTYNRLVKEYEAELFSLEQSIGAIKHPLETDTAISDAYKDFFGLLNEVTECKKLTKPLLRNLIDRIEVEQGHYEKDAHGKKVKKQKIKIYYRFIGCISDREKTS